MTSDAILDEFEGVLVEKFGLSRRDARDAKDFVRGVAEVVHPTIVLDNCILEAPSGPRRN